MSNKPSLGLGTKLGAAAVRHGDNKGDLNVIMIDKKMFEIGGSLFCFLSYMITNQTNYFDF